jgi:DNA adenine methylase
MSVRVPPIKCQGIKTKLVPFIKNSIEWDAKGTWIEPFTGSGVVGFNLAPKYALFSDTNPHLIRFYQDIKDGIITSGIVKSYLIAEGENLLGVGEDHYYKVRSRFNSTPNSLDFLFLNRSCFNGVMRFNRKGGFNVPFCRKPSRFAQAYVTKIVNQVTALEKVIKANSWTFVCQDFSDSIKLASCDDFIYADPPYIGRHVDYYGSWDDEKEKSLFQLLNNSPARFILSTWEENSFRRNEYIDNLWPKFHKLTQDHFYHVGGSEDNRNAMTEALIMNFQPSAVEDKPQVQANKVQMALAL